MTEAGSSGALPRVVHAVLNPSAGRGRARAVWDLAEPALRQAGCELRLHPTCAPGDGLELARGLPLEPDHAVVAVGGDGSFHEVVNGLLDRPDGLRVPLGLLAGGTGNAFARDAALMDPLQVARRMASGWRRPLDVMHLESARAPRHAFNIVGWGLAAEVAFLAERWRALGRRRYDLASAWLAVGGRHVEARLELDDERLEGEFSMVLAANNRTTGAGMVLLPEARFDDGLLDVLVVRRLGRLRLLRLLASVPAGGHLDHPAVVVRRVRRLAIEGPGGLNVDGDGVADGAPVALRVEPGAVELLG